MSREGFSLTLVGEFSESIAVQMATTTNGKLRVAVYASASKRTPAAYLEAAREVGESCARRGYVLVNGGGKHGGMGALNAGCRSKGGHIVCVIHERFIVDGAKFDEADDMIVARGDSLGERKRLLLANADVVLALPGGVGTFDELLEAIVLGQLNFQTAKPVVLLDVDNYYENLRAQLQRAHKDGLLIKSPDDLLYATDNIQDALDYCEKKHATRQNGHLSSSSSSKSKNLLLLRSGFFQHQPFTLGLGIGLLLGAVIAVSSSRRFS